MKDLQNYIHHYVGCPCYIGAHDFTYRISADIISRFKGEVKPKLRLLTDMSLPEAEHLAWLQLNHKLIGQEVSKTDIKVAKSTFIHQTNSIVFDVSYRWFSGTLAIPNNGDIRFMEADCKNLPLKNTAETFRYLLSCGFDLFGLIEDGLAVELKAQEKAV